jgi:hypothetical protein
MGCYDRLYNITSGKLGGGGGYVRKWRFDRQHAAESNSVYICPSDSKHLPGTNSSKKMAPKRKIQVNWEIHPRALYLIHEVRSNSEENTKVELLAECTAPGRLTGHYRWAFGGGNVEFSRRLNNIMDVEEEFWLDINCKPDDINIRENNCTGPWEDLADWVSKDKIGVQRNNENARDALLGKQIYKITMFLYNL